MAETTNIEWADSTLNIWMGCQETGSPACVGCYARQLVEGRFGLTTWGPHGQRVETKSWRANLRRISRMALAAFAAGRTEPWFVFVNSLSDFWDNQADPKLRAEALAEFRKHPHLTFLLLTKRPQNIVKLFRETLSEADKFMLVDPPLMDIADCWPRNVAIGFTAVTQKELDRDWPHMESAAAALNPLFVFWSGEPLVEIVQLPAAFLAMGPRAWAITGGGTDQGKHKAYPTPYNAFRQVRDDCAAAGVAYLHKQNGEWVDHFSPEAEAARKANTFPMGLRNDMRTRTVRVGKKVAGRMLDGRTHDERPSVRHLEAA